MKGPWIICPTCMGEGNHSRDLGCITQEDRDRDWSPDEWEDYLEGAYDRVCGTCGGSGKVRESEEVWRRHNLQLCFERGVNDAGEPL